MGEAERHDSPGSGGLKHLFVGVGPEVSEAAVELRWVSNYDVAKGRHSPDPVLATRACLDVPDDPTWSREPAAGCRAAVVDVLALHRQGGLSREQHPAG